MKRRTVPLSDEALEALDRIAKANHTTVSGVVEAAGLILNGGAGPGPRPSSVASSRIVEAATARSQRPNA